jgi:quercetin dioxygenase-like cupin family protein
MKKINIYENNLNLEVFKDERGIIADVFFNADINHVALITSEPNALRGNHYHAATTQHILITEGSLEYWYSDALSKSESSYEICKVGDLATSEPGEIHALRIGDNGCTFIAFTTGQRGGSDYESDTFRVPDITRPLQN